MPHPKTPLMAAVCLCASSAVTVTAGTGLESFPAAGSIHIDGHPEDWEGRPFAYLEHSLRSVSVAHDADDIFLMYRFGDERLARQLLRDGVILWINGDGRTNRKDEKFGVRYAGSQEIADVLSAAQTEPPEKGRDSGPRRHPRNLTDLRLRPGELTVIRFGVKDVSPEGLAGQPEAASAVQDGVFCYELRIPIYQIGGKIADQPATKRRKVALGIQIGGTTEAERENIVAAIQDALGRGGGPSGTMGGDGGRGGGAGGMGGGGRGGMGGHGGEGGRSGRGSDPSAMKDGLNPKVEWLVVELPPFQ